MPGSIWDAIMETRDQERSSDEDHFCDHLAFSVYARTELANVMRVELPDKIQGVQLNLNLVT